MTRNMRGVRAGLGIIAVVAMCAGLGTNAARAEEGDTTSTTRPATTTTEDPYYSTTTSTRPPDPPEDQQPSGDGSQTTPTTDGNDPTVPTVPGDDGDGGDDDGSGGGDDGAGGNGGGSDGGGDSGQTESTTGHGAVPSSIDPSAPRVVPPGFQELINSVRRSKANSTTSLLAALQPLQDLGLTAEEAIAQGFGRFPIAGYATFVDDWWFPRFTPSFHLHQGTDIFAVHGTPVRSPVDGILKQGNGAVGGLAAYVTQPDGTYFYLAHLSGFAPGQTTGQRVKVGEIVGFVGDTGNAAGGAPHVHLQLHPKGGPPVNPKPYLDQFITEALAAVPSLIASREVGRPRALLTTGLTRRMTEGRGAFAAPGSPPRSELLWASSASPGGALALAEAEVSAAARGVDWDELARDRQDERLEWAAADRRAQSLLGPVTPPALAQYLDLPRIPQGESFPTVMAAPQGDTPGD
ncbi:MAG TPA: M23 family metallopeptidase [Acidimicrobiales bacterium]|nr:M23 family metallopeptidase [Acidimicrobiales bacterium]